MDDRDQILLRALLGPELKWEEVMDILHVVRRRGFTEYNSKMQCHVPTRFCLYNIAFFDLDKECKHILDLCSFILTLLSFPWSTGIISKETAVYILWLCRSHVPTHNMMCIYMYKNHILGLISIAGLHFTAEDVPWPPIHQIPQPLRNWLYDSVDVIAIKVAQSDRKGPISIYMVLCWRGMSTTIDASICSGVEGMIHNS